jgi:hypothetical protein
MSKGFGNPKKSKLDILAESVVFYCQQRSPEKLDTIFDYQSPEINHQICAKLVAVLDIDTIAWFCGYLASEINCTQDNNNTSISSNTLEFSTGVIQNYNNFPGRLGNCD